MCIFLLYFHRYLCAFVLFSAILFALLRVYENLINIKSVKKGCENYDHCYYIFRIRTVYYVKKSPSKHFGKQNH